ncbi:UDP-N-acetylmuramoyl-L-alanine--D-glutamate ligase [Paenibacillus senegalensis]|uniref:UDP-N-acetylmuramoyl-L-alanine--D-glutamate ligase n=1 Tax=Paenibacillus senegalensis TaxID=1465766 RepID=UPI0003147C28|nr:UDP-N-acetylmuramoyl-L-alanine--D-glutamate ligase [Paenibacillus senegalensis]
MKEPYEYKNKQVVVIGLARSGAAAAKLLHSWGAVVTANDLKSREQCPEADELEALGISVVCGEHPPGLISREVELVVKNPGIPYRADPIKQAEKLGIEVVTEVELAYVVSRAPIIGITGSNGKTTTTTWVGEMLEASGLRPIVAGNIGRPLADAAMQAEKDQWLVAELSSFQLKGTQRFRPQIACLLNVSETHLDYHGTMKDYTASKFKLFANQCKEDIAVLNWDDGECRRLASQLTAKVLPFSTKEQLEEGVFIRRHAESGQLERDIVYRPAGGDMRHILRASEVGVPGSFNLENALAAAAIAIAAGVSLTVIAESLRQFRGVEHRLEWVAEHQGVLIYNNSKSTNATATIKALEGFDRPVVLIAGGLDRQKDKPDSGFEELIPIFQAKLKGLIALGETRHKLANAAQQANVGHVVRVDAADPEEAMDQAVQSAASLCKEGDILLLSPCCASWDMFASFEERGSMFKQSVHNLLTRG